eukprot:4909409-Pyramimonas_sp.AAC.1
MGSSSPTPTQASARVMSLSRLEASGPSASSPLCIVFREGGGGPMLQDGKALTGGLILLPGSSPPRRRAAAGRAKG